MALSHKTRRKDKSCTHNDSAPKLDSLPILTGVRARLADGARSLIDEASPELERLCSAWFKLPGVSRKRAYIGFYPPDRVFFMFLKQVLDSKGTCDKAVADLSATLVSQGKPRPSSNTAGYCQARRRLLEEDLEAVHGSLVKRIPQDRGSQHRWCGRNVKVVDGTTVSLPDTPANQAAYPQPTCQKEGCGFPIVRLVTVFDLATGAMVDMARGPAYGPQAVGERTLYRSLWDTFRSDEVILGDRGFCSWVDVYGLQQRGVHSVVRRLHRVPCEVVAILGEGDRLVRWKKPKKCPDHIDPQEWEPAPDSLVVREVTFAVAIPGFRTRTITVVTTLLDSKAFPKEELAELYRRRWLCELWLRDLKIPMNMDILTCHSPDMVHKEIWMHVIGYNLVRALINAAAQAHNVPVHRISFTRTLVALQAWAPRLAKADRDDDERIRLWQALLSHLASLRVPDRPNRTAPRALKRRPKNFPVLNKPRDQFHEIPHRNRYRAAVAAQRSEQTMTCAS